MSLNNTCAPEIDPCDTSIFAVPSQYMGTTVESSIMAQLNCLSTDSNSARTCGIFDCNTAEGDILTLIGESVGWPRSHCNVQAQPYFGLCLTDNGSGTGTGCNQASVVGLCAGEYFYCRLSERSDYVFTDDVLYRSFIKAKAIKNRAVREDQTPDVSLIDEIIKSLWGDDAWVVEANGGFISVSAGRNLTAEEQSILSLYGKVICAGFGIEIRIFCLAPFKPIGCNRNPIPNPNRFIICSDLGNQNNAPLANSNLIIVCSDNGGGGQNNAPVPNSDLNIVCTG